MSVEPVPGLVADCIQLQFRISTNKVTSTLGLAKSQAAIEAGRTGQPEKTGLKDKTVLSRAQKIFLDPVHTETLHEL